MKIINKKKKIILSCILTISLVITCLCINTSSKATEATNDNLTDYSSISRDTSISVDENGVLNISRNKREKEQIMGPENTWTLFVYMTGSNLESQYECASYDIEEMLKANFTEENIKNVNVIIQTGGSKDWHSNRICSNKIERFKVDTNSFRITNLARMENASMGSSDTLYDFLNWGINNYPAEHMGVVFWNHGSGVSRGLCFDENYDDDSLSVHELEYTFAKINKKMTSKFELIGFDTCLTGSLEYANILAPYAKYMVGSADVAIAKGWYYTDVINYLLENPDATGDQLGKVVCNSTAAFMEDYYKRNPVDYTYATYDLSKVDKVCIETNYLAKYLYDTLISDPSKYDVLAKFNKSRLIFAHECVDIGSILYYFENTSELNYDTTYFRQALNELIIHCNFKNKFDNQKSGIGITLFMPFNDCNLQQLNTYRNVCFSPYLLKYLEYIKAGSIRNDMSNYQAIPWENSPYFFENNFDFINYDTDYSKEKNISEITKNKLMENSNYATDGFPLTWYNNLATNNNTRHLENESQKPNKNFVLPDGQALTTYIISQNNTTTIYSFPVLINEEESSIRIEETLNSNGETTYTTLGVWDASDSPYNNNKIARGYLPLKENSIIVPMYDVFDIDLNEYTTEYGDEFIISNEFEYYITENNN